MIYKCARCEDHGWVCENHDDKPWREGEGGCTCGAGAPCPACNVANADNPPRLPAEFEQIEIADPQPKFKRYRPSDEERQRMLTINASKGGKAAAKNLTRDQRRARARHASRARWAKQRDN